MIRNNVEQKVLGEELVVDGQTLLTRMGSTARSSIGGFEKQYAEKNPGWVNSPSEKRAMER